MSSCTVSLQARRLQLQLIAMFFLLISLLYCLFYWSCQAQYALFGATARACVVDIEDDYNSSGVRLPYHKIDYQYFDDEAKVVRHGCNYLSFASPTPALGETFVVKYLPNHADSSYVPDGNHPLTLLWVTVPVLVFFGLITLSVRRGEWIF